MDCSVAITVTRQQPLGLCSCQQPVHIDNLLRRTRRTGSRSSTHRGVLLAKAPGGRTARLARVFRSYRAGAASCVIVAVHMTVHVLCHHHSLPEAQPSSTVWRWGRGGNRWHRGEPMHRPCIPGSLPAMLMLMLMLHA